MNALKKTLAVFFWLALWQLAAVLIDKAVILVTPVEAVKRLAELIFTADFYKTVLNSFLRISLGFFLGAFSGIALAVLAGRFKTVKTLLSPFVSAVTAIPVAAVIIFLLFFVKSSQLSVLVSLLIVFPIIYRSVCEGVQSTDKKLIEAADVFRFSNTQKIRYLYLPSVMPFLTAAVKASAGLAFKSGTAAEVIGQPDFTLGDMLYRAKIYLETADLFAWTIVIIIIGRIFELAVTALLNFLYKRSQCISAAAKFKGGVCSDD